MKTIMGSSRRVALTFRRRGRRSVQLIVLLKKTDGSFLFLKRQRIFPLSHDCCPNNGPLFVSTTTKPFFTFGSRLD